jgi:hypothetical protein
MAIGKPEDITPERFQLVDVSMSTSDKLGRW